MQANKNTRENMLLLIEEMVCNDILHNEDLRVFQRNPEPCSPAEVTKTMEDWYIGMGIKSIIGRHLAISQCPFSREEILEAPNNKEAILCVPGCITRTQLGELFRIDTWALHDRLVTKVPEEEDLWFRTGLGATPLLIKKEVIYD